MKLHILGGGPAGMAASYYASKNNLKSTVYEASSSVGGNCKTIKIDDFLFDLGAHRFHDKNPIVTKEIRNILGSELLTVYSPSKIFFKNSFLDFPLRIVNILTTLKLQENFKIIIENLSNQFKNYNDPLNFKDVAYQNYGKTLSNLFLINYTEKLWGLPCDQLLPNISGGRLKNLNLKSVMMELFFNQKSNSKHLDGQFLYPKYGYGSIFETIKNSYSDQEVLLNSSITKLIHDGSKITKIEINNSKQINVNNVISTLPINLLIKNLHPSVDNNLLEIADSLKFRGLKLCVLFLNKKFFSENASIYFPDKNIPFTRIYEPKNRSKYTAPNDKTCIVIEVPYNQCDLQINNNDLIDQVIKILENKKLLNYSDVLFKKIYDLPFAYPILDLNVKQKLNKLLSFLKKFNNLYLIGRNAEFQYQHTHDIFINSKKLLENLADKIK